VNQAASRRGSRGWGWYRKAVDEMNRQKEPPRPFPEAASGHKRPAAFFDISVDNDHIGRIEIELADDILPTTVGHFRDLCEGKGDYKYKGTKFHQVHPGFMVSGGDVKGEGGFGGHLANADGPRFFEDENFAIQHSLPGIVSLANSGVDTNGSQFFITTVACPHLDGRNVAFGQVVKGMDVVENIENQFAVKGKPVTNITIMDSGMVE